MAQRALKALLWLLVCVQLSGCATVLGGWKDRINLTPASGNTPAEVWLDGERIGDAPGTILLEPRRIQHGSVLELRAEGAPTQSFRLERRLHQGYFWLDVASTLGLALIVDFGTGYIYTPSPRNIVYDLSTSNTP